MLAHQITTCSYPHEGSPPLRCFLETICMTGLREDCKDRFETCRSIMIILGEDISAILLSHKNIFMVPYKKTKAQALAATFTGLCLGICSRLWVLSHYPTGDNCSTVHYFLDGFGLLIGRVFPSTTHSHLLKLYSSLKALLKATSSLILSPKPNAPVRERGSFLYRNRMHFIQLFQWNPSIYGG